MMRPSARQYAALPSDQSSMRRRRRLRLENLEEIAAANSLQDLVLGGFLDGVGASVPTQSSIGDFLKSPNPVGQASRLPVPVEQATSLPLPVPTINETTTIDPTPSRPLLPASAAVDLANADLWLIGNNEPTTPPSHSSPTEYSAGTSGGSASAGIAPSNSSENRPAAFDPVKTPNADTSIATPTAPSATPLPSIAPTASVVDSASIRSAQGNATIKLKANGDSLASVFSAKAPQTQDFTLPYGLFGFTVTDVTPGGIATVDLTLPKGAKVDGYYKQDPRTQALDRFNFDGQTGAVVRDNTVTLYLQDGGRGDDDGIVNGVVLDPGGPGYSWTDIVTAAQVREVTFSGSSLIAIEADPGTPAYPSPPQWLDTDVNGSIDLPGDRALPIGYPRNTNSVVSAHFKATISSWPYPPSIYSLMVRGSNTLTAINPYYYTVPPTPVTLTGTDLYLPPTTIVNPFAGPVNYGTLAITWEFSNSGGASWSGAGHTENELYVTLDTPEDTPVWHTAIHLFTPAAALAAALTSATVISTAITEWNKLTATTRNCDPANNAKPIYYYKDWDTMKFTADQVLANRPDRDGQCSAMVDLFAMGLRNLGVKKAANPMTALAVGSVNTSELMLVKNWAFAGDGTSTNMTYPYQNTLSDPKKDPGMNQGKDVYWRQKADLTWEYFWGNTAEVTDAAGLKGQNTDNPKSTFFLHVLLKIGTQFYDPSYGKGPYNSIKDWEEASIAGLAVRETFDTDPKTYRLLIRKNPAGLPADTEEKTINDGTVTYPKSV